LTFDKRVVLHGVADPTLKIPQTGVSHRIGFHMREREREEAGEYTKSITFHMREGRRGGGGLMSLPRREGPLLQGEREGGVGRG